MFQIKFRILKIVKIENKYRVRDKLSQTEKNIFTNIILIRKKINENL